MMQAISIGSVVRRMEPPLSGRARVIGLVSSPYQLDYELEYEEGGSGWWPADSIELVIQQDS
jgi:hypothetical protein